MGLQEGRGGLGTAPESKEPLHDGSEPLEGPGGRGTISSLPGFPSLASTLFRKKLFHLQRPRTFCPHFPLYYVLDSQTIFLGIPEALQSALGRKEGSGAGWVIALVPVCPCHLHGEMGGAVSVALVLTPGAWGGPGGR